MIYTDPETLKMFPAPSLTRPALHVIERTSWCREHDVLYGGDPECEHYVYAAASGLKCAKCPGWFCL